MARFRDYYNIGREIISVGNENNELLVKFDKPYTFEGVDYNEIDLSRIENLSTKDLINADKTVLKYRCSN